MSYRDGGGMVRIDADGYMVKASGHDEAGTEPATRARRIAAARGNMLWCKNKHPDGVCQLNGEYCVEGPCPHEELIEYEPVKHGTWLWRPMGAFCTACNRYLNYYVYGYLRCPMCGAHMDLEGGPNP